MGKFGTDEDSEDIQFMTTGIESPLIPPPANVFTISDTLCERIGDSALALLKEGYLCDLTFLVGPSHEEVKCHSLFLIARSPVIRAMLSTKMESSEGIEVIPLEDVDPEIFRLFLEFIYGDKFTHRIPEATKLLQLADKYGVRPLVQKCEELISRDIQREDAIQTFLVARKYSLQDLMKKAGDIITKEFLELSKDPSFQEMDEETLIHILKRDDLAVLESELFTIVLRWASDQMARREAGDASYADVLKNIIPLIRFPLMTAQEFVTHVFPMQILSQKDVIDLFLYFNSDEKLRQDIAKRLQFSTVPREREVELSIQLYEAVAPVRASNLFFNSNFETLEPCDSHTDDLEFIFKSKTCRKKEHEGHDARIVSLLLQGPDYDILKEVQDPPDIQSECSEYRMAVTIEQIGTAESTFAKECTVVKGKQSELQVLPHFVLRDGCKYRVRATFQTNALEILEHGSRKMAYKHDMLSSADLKPSAAELTLMGTVSLEGIRVAPWGQIDKDSTDYGPVSLHVVRGLKLMAK